MLHAAWTMLQLSKWIQCLALKELQIRAHGTQIVHLRPASTPSHMQLLYRIDISGKTSQQTNLGSSELPKFGSKQDQK